ncbi:AfsR/SARP family transcriptional regulator [Occultella gossypii]|uniref:Tetratricopeptide repeat protein n=1 Tax=Occultella gossypii TaxID=2800820 RepID=A0ABS7SD29_9MICO|nr:BTAD domain-containing putative transcriptional regulator [Occultella gossypii]MBZ2197788.1 tetratricopeptide repeat protein [Occultella gossypii]
MRFGVLGPLLVLDGDTDVTPSGRLQRTLLAHLLAHVNRPVTAGVLAEAAWPGEPEGGPGRLQVHLHRLRKLLDNPDRLSHGPDGYVLHADTDEVDATRFDDLAARALAPGNGHEKLLDAAIAAENLWRGDAYADLEGIAVRAEAHRLTERRLGLLEVRYTVELDIGRHAAVLSDLATLAAGHPLRERIQGLLIAALARVGRQAEALAPYRDTRNALVETLGVEPGPELRGVHAAVLSGAPAPGEGSGRRIPAQLPPAVDEFHGRTAELADLDSASGDGARVILLAGTAGVGKTSLAVHWAHRRSAQFPDGQLYADLRGFSAQSPRDPESVLGAWLRASGVGAAEVPERLEDRSALMRSVLARRRMLLIADNAADAEQVRPLLPGTDGSLLLVTSRHAMPGLVARDGAHRVALRGLAPDDSLDVLTSLLPVRPSAGSDALARLASLCGHLPLALRMLAERIPTEPDRSLDDLAGQLTDAHALLDALDAGGDGDTDVRAVFSWSYERLDADARHVLHHLGLLPGPRAGVHSLAALAGTDMRTAGRALDALVRAHLVERTAQARFAQHDLLGAYARELAQEKVSPAEQVRALERLVDHTAYTAAAMLERWDPNLEPVTVELDVPPTPIEEPGSPEDCAAWFEIEAEPIADLVEAAAAQGLPGAVGLARAYGPASAWIGNLAAGERAMRAALPLAGSDRVQARMELSLSLLLDEQGRTDEAIHHTGAAITRLAGAPADRDALTTTRIALATANLGVYESNRGHLARAEELLRDALGRYRELGTAPLEARVLGSLGNTVVDRGRAQEGIDILEEAITRARACASEEAECLGLWYLASAELHCLRNGRALEHARSFLSLARTLHIASVVPIALTRVGQALCLDGDHTGARRHLLEALELARSGEVAGHLPDALNALGVLDRSEGDPGTALARHHAVLAMTAPIRAPETRARAHVHLGEAYEDLGDVAAAQRHYARAEVRYARIETVNLWRAHARIRLGTLSTGLRPTEAVAR